MIRRALPRSDTRGSESSSADGFSPTACATADRSSVAGSSGATPTDIMTRGEPDGFRSSQTPMAPVRVAQRNSAIVAPIDTPFAGEHGEGSNGGMTAEVDLDGWREPAQREIGLRHVVELTKQVSVCPSSRAMRCI